ncbi:MAG: serine/threonine protein kinase [Gemmatimonadetes bacterium]|nr:MAG: serine/threonine protein kinase [Gemmatimonadota bacterium]
MSERRCPKCGSVYTDAGARFCPKDGSMLVEIQARKPAAPPSPKASGGSGTGVRTPLPPGKAGLDRASSLSNQILDARYQVMKKLGEGGMSYVYLAKEISTGDTVAIKVLSPRLASDKSSVERLRREAGLAMRLDHPNVCRILRLGESEDGLIYLVMPFLKGELLSDREVRGGPMDMTLGVTLLKQMCAGLHHAHELQIIHRDLKPENVMLVPDDDGGGGGGGAGGVERAVVMDFGLAKERRADPAIAKLTATGIILGTPEFMSPEQIRGKPLDARSDIYALGIVAFEMFTGKLPFSGRNAQEMMIARLRSQPIAIRTLRTDVPDTVEKALAKALQTNPDNRFSTAIEFAEALTGSAPSSGGGGGGGGGGGFLGKLKEKFS